ASWPDPLAIDRMRDVEFIRDKVPLAGLFGVVPGFGLDRLSAGKGLRALAVRVFGRGHRGPYVVRNPRHDVSRQTPASQNSRGRPTTALPQNAVSENIGSAFKCSQGARRSFCDNRKRAWKERTDGMGHYDNHRTDLACP